MLPVCYLQVTHHWVWSWSLLSETLCSYLYAVFRWPATEFDPGAPFHSYLYVVFRWPATGFDPGVPFNIIVQLSVCMSSGDPPLGFDPGAPFQHHCAVICKLSSGDPPLGLIPGVPFNIIVQLSVCCLQVTCHWVWSWSPLFTTFCSYCYLYVIFRLITIGFDPGVPFNIIVQLSVCALQVTRHWVWSWSPLSTTSWMQPFNILLHL